MTHLNARGADIPGALIGGLISAAFASVWAIWGTSGASADTATVIRVVAAAASVALIVSAALLHRRAPSGATGGGSMFSSTAYRLIVAGEIVLVFGGSRALSATGGGAYVIVWAAFVIGAHFVAFGWSFWPGFYAIGAIMVIGAFAGLMVGVAEGSPFHIRAVTGLIAAIDLFLASTWSVLYADRSIRTGASG